MTVFTAIGVLWFWSVCFEIGYSIVPTIHAAQAAFAIWLFGREAERLQGFIAALAQHQQEKTG